MDPPKPKVAIAVQDLLRRDTEDDDDAASSEKKSNSGSSVSPLVKEAEKLSLKSEPANAQAKLNEGEGAEYHHHDDDKKDGYR